MRILPEWEVVRAVLAEHDLSSGGKFIDEVCWRTYWKGWLQLRPTVWTEYRAKVDCLKTDGGMTTKVTEAMAGRTGIDCFDAWARELEETGYLHNHARMWTASIWIHTLKLPWELGADWFLRHLLDGDPASNTLSWRWVAGLHTAGKTYLASRENIRKYTNSRFDVCGELATTPAILKHSPHPPERLLPELTPAAGKGRVGILLTDEDMSAAEWLIEDARADAVAGFFPKGTYHDMGISDRVMCFRREAMRSALGKPGCDALFESVDRIRDWINETRIEVLLMAEPPVGIWSNILPEIAQMCHEAGVDLSMRRHGWDSLLWPYATHGFFRFKQAIPQAVARLAEW